MHKKQFIERCDSRLKLVRTEYGLSQEHMALILGISKKTLVDIEKQRRSLGWTGRVAFCFLFQDSEVLAGTFGGNPTDMVLALSLEVPKQLNYPQTWGGKLWWELVQENEQYLIQQNIISQHYRLLTKDRKRVASSFQIEDLLPIFNAVNKK